MKYQSSAGCIYISAAPIPEPQFMGPPNPELVNDTVSAYINALREPYWTPPV